MATFDVASNSGAGDEADAAEDPCGLPLRTPPRTMRLSAPAAMLDTWMNGRMSAPPPYWVPQPAQPAHAVPPAPGQQPQHPQQPQQLQQLATMATGGHQYQRGLDAGLAGAIPTAFDRPPGSHRDYRRKLVLFQRLCGRRGPDCEAEGALTLLQRLPGKA